MTAVDHLTDKHGEDTYERVQRYNPLSSRYKQVPQKREETTTVKQEDITVEEDRRSNRRSTERRPHQHRHTAELPSPERERSENYHPPPPVVDDRDYDQQSENSARVLRNYENERDDPRRKPDREYYRRDMAYYDDQRPSSRGAPRSRSRYDDDGGSDYDEHTGRRYQTSGRGYEQDRRSRDYDREIIETEVYRGPPRDWGAQRSSSYQGEQNGEYAVTQYRGGNSNELAPYDDRDRRRSRSRARSHRDDYDDRDRSRSRSREKGEGIRGKLEDTFDTSKRGVGAGLLGAVVGGLAGRQFGDKKHGARDMVIGAVVGGLAVNAAEQKYHQYKENKAEKERYDYDDRDYRSRSAMR
ncbi:hypothetical protein AMS68_003975 [Peltaster fructicola]|uniref:Uncharacterized protein n=1 Tax=Peltaster fructicola TaxID=286661 RepID=A0A6H0XV20_9PEZI|nr:hypothetical protein AMS68_003975 [Peltaster fructicola]